jgi:hypothetical protein
MCSETHCGFGDEDNQNRTHTNASTHFWMKTMNIKMKLAALAAIATLAAPAFADVSALAASDTFVDGAAVNADGLAVVVDVATSTIVTDFDGTSSQVALIVQNTDGNIALVDQTGTGGYASIVQDTNAANVVTLFQNGAGNRAVVFQH